MATQRKERLRSPKGRNGIEADARFTLIRKSMKDIDVASSGEEERVEIYSATAEVMTWDF